MGIVTLSMSLPCSLIVCKLDLSPVRLSYQTLSLALLGDHDCLLGLLTVGASVVHRAELGAPGLLLLAKAVFSGIVVLKFGGVSPEKSGIKEGCKGFVFTLREVPCGIAEFLDGMMLALLTEEDCGGGTEFF